MKLKIGCDTYTVETVDKLGIWGQCFTSKRLIKIDKHISAKDRTITIFHESVHAMISAYGLHVPEEIEEMVVRIIENAICKFFQDNPAFGRQMIKYLSQRKQQV